MVAAARFDDRAVAYERIFKTNMAIDGRKERVQFDKITARVSRLCYGLDAEHVDAAAITQKVISGVYQGVTTIELDNLVSLHFRKKNPLRTSLTPFSGRRNRCVHDRHPSRLRHPCCTYCSLQPSQADEETILDCHLRLIPLCQPTKQESITHDLKSHIRDCHET